MVTADRIGIMADIIRLCETSKDKHRIMSELSLNDVQTESYLTILRQQRMIMQSGGKFVVTGTGQSYLSSYDRLRKIRF